MWVYLHTYQTSRRIERTLSLHTHPPTFKGYMKEMWVYLECIYITTFRGGMRERTLLSVFRGIWENCESTYLPTNLQGGCERAMPLPTYLWGDTKELWVYLPNYLPTFKRDVRELWVIYLPLYLSWGCKKTESTYLPTKLLGGCERTVSYLPTFTVHSHPPRR